MNPFTDTCLQNLNVSYIPALYIHIPFCKQKCFYCDFYSEANQTQAIMQDVLREIQGQLSFFSNAGATGTLQTLAIGGGTPSIIPVKSLNAFLESISGYKTCGLKEFTIEINPESCTKPLLTLLRENKVSRISLGIQALSDSSLQKIGRLASREMNLGTLELIRTDWPGELNIDLISGLPDQTPGSLKQEIREVLTFQPDHISLYALSVEEETPLAGMLETGSLQLLSDEKQEQLWLTGVDVLTNHNYNQYEVSNFALSGKECKHNLHYWNMNPYLGIGPGAVSTLPGKENTILRIYTPPNIKQFLKGKTTNWGMEFEYISVKEFLYENLMMGFRLAQGINKDSFRQRFGCRMEILLPRTLKRWMKSGILQETESGFRFSGKNRYFLNRHLLDIATEITQLAESGLQLCWPELSNKKV